MCFTRLVYRERKPMVLGSNHVMLYNVPNWRIRTRVSQLTFTFTKKFQHWQPTHNAHNTLRHVPTLTYIIFSFDCITYAHRIQTYTSKSCPPTDGLQCSDIPLRELFTKYTCEFVNKLHYNLNWQGICLFTCLNINKWKGFG